MLFVGPSNRLFRLKTQEVSRFVSPDGFEISKGVWLSEPILQFEPGTEFSFRMVVPSGHRI